MIKVSEISSIYSFTILVQDAKTRYEKRKFHNFLFIAIEMIALNVFFMKKRPQTLEVNNFSIQGKDISTFNLCIQLFRILEF